MQKTGHVERTVDREFMEEETRYRTYVWPLSSGLSDPDAAFGRFLQYGEGTQ